MRKTSSKNRLRSPPLLQLYLHKETWRVFWRQLLQIKASSLLYQLSQYAGLPMWQRKWRILYSLISSSWTFSLTWLSLGRLSSWLLSFQRSFSSIWQEESLWCWPFCSSCSATFLCWFSGPSIPKPSTSSQFQQELRFISSTFSWQWQASSSSLLRFAPPL